MATAFKNLSEYDKDAVPNGADFKIGIIVSEWNSEITFNLLKGAHQTLLDNGVKEENIHVEFVPGTFELALASKWAIKNLKLDGAIAIGSVIQGETRHFDFVCQGATQGIMHVGLKTETPLMFCVLTDDNIQQSRDRSGGKYGNKGIDCAISCLKMIDLKRRITEKKK